MTMNLNFDFGNGNAKYICNKSSDCHGNMLALMLYDQKFFNGQVKILGSLIWSDFWSTFNVMRKRISAERDSCES
jgi:hypothetical protein